MKIHLLASSDLTPGRKSCSLTLGHRGLAVSCSAHLSSPREAFAEQGSSFSAVLKETRNRYEREALTLTDGEKVELCWLRHSSRPEVSLDTSMSPKEEKQKLLILSHGRSHSANSRYVIGAALKAYEEGWDCLAWSERGSLGVSSTSPRWYSALDYPDLSEVVYHAHSLEKYDEIALWGVSLGGIVTNNYLGKLAHEVPDSVSKAITFSVPLNSEKTMERISTHSDGRYRTYFKRRTQRALLKRAIHFPDLISSDEVRSSRTLQEIDTKFKRPMYGFGNDLQRFYKECDPKDLKRFDPTSGAEEGESTKES